MQPPKHSIEGVKILKDISSVASARASSWSAAQVLPDSYTASDSTVMNTSTSLPYGSGAPSTPTVGINPYPTTVAPSTFGTIQTSFGFPPEPEPEPDECEDGHYIDQKTVRTFVEDGEDTITGRCVFCDVTVYLPELEGILAFERAGKAVGRAMTLEDGDDENIGALLAEVSRIERDLKAELTKYKRALGMLEIARDLVEQRACA